MGYLYNSDSWPFTESRYKRDKRRCCENYNDMWDCRCDDYWCNDCCMCCRCCCVTPEAPSVPFLSSYVEALGDGQDVSVGGKIVFDVDSVDSVGNNITLDSTGTVFTINRTGLYRVEWSVNLAHDTTSAVIGIQENGNFASGASSTTGGSFSSGTLINVETVPFTLSLINFDSDITLVHPSQWTNSAVSIRISRFADGNSR